MEWLSKHDCWDSQKIITDFCSRVWIIAHVEYDIDSHVCYDLLGYEYCSMSAFACRALFFFACQPASQSNQLTVNLGGFYFYGGDSSR